jgi:hypothetical protein
LDDGELRVALGSSQKGEPVTSHASWQGIDGEGKRLEVFVKERLGLNLRL